MARFGKAGRGLVRLGVVGRCEAGSGEARSKTGRGGIDSPPRFGL